jgi:hypothetical protein
MQFKCHASSNRLFATRHTITDAKSTSISKLHCFDKELFLCFFLIKLHTRIYVLTVKQGGCLQCLLSKQSLVCPHFLPNEKCYIVFLCSALKKMFFTILFPHTLIPFKKTTVFYNWAAPSHYQWMKKHPNFCHFKFLLNYYSLYDGSQNCHLHHLYLTFIPV